MRRHAPDTAKVDGPGCVSFIALVSVCHDGDARNTAGTALNAHCTPVLGVLSSHGQKVHGRGSARWPHLGRRLAA